MKNNKLVTLGFIAIDTGSLTAAINHPNMAETVKLTCLMVYMILWYRSLKSVLFS